MDSKAPYDRRDFLKAAGAAGLTANLFTGRLRGANDRITLGFIGIGAQGTSNLRNALNARFIAASASFAVSSAVVSNRENAPVAEACIEQATTETLSENSQIATPSYSPSAKK